MTYAKVSSKLSAVVDVPITILRSPYPITKRFELGPSGLIKTPAAPLSTARAEVYTVSDAAGLLTMFESFTSQNAVLLGRFKDGDDLDVVAHEPIGRQVRRTKEYTEFPNGACWAVLDVDAAHCTTVYHTPEEVHAALVEIAPCLDGVDCLVTSSTSSGIYAGDTQLRGYGGWHVWIRLARGTDWPDFTSWLFDRCWMFGLAHHIVSKSGGLLERGLIDVSVSSPERVQYSGPPTLGEGLEVRRLARVFGEPGRELSSWKKLSADDKREVAQKKDMSSHSKVGVCKERRDAWIIERVEAMGGVVGDITLTGVAIGALESKHLGDQWLLTLDDGVVVTVAEVVEHRTKYNGRKCLDPIEPDYDGGKVVGRIYSELGKCFLHSFAHGATTYRLGGSAEALAELHRTMVYVKGQNVYINRENPREISTATNLDIEYAQEYGSRKTASLLNEMGVQVVQTSLWWPGKPIIYTYQGVQCLNTCPSLHIEPNPDADVSLWLDHVSLIMGVEAEWFLNYLAFAIQHPDKKQNCHPIIGGGQGVGKDVLLRPIKKVYSALGVYGEVDSLPSLLDYDDGLVHVKFIVVTECAVRDMEKRTQNRLATKLKPHMCSTGAETQMLNPKSKGRLEQANVGSWISLTNETVPMKLDADDSRYVFRWYGGSPESREYFTKLHDWIDNGGAELVVGWLAARDWMAGGYSPNHRAHSTDEKQVMMVSAEYGDSHVVEDVLALPVFNGVMAVSLQALYAAANLNGWEGTGKGPKADEQVLRAKMGEYATRNKLKMAADKGDGTRRTAIVIDEKYLEMGPYDRVRYCKMVEGKINVKKG